MMVTISLVLVKTNSYGDDDKYFFSNNGNSKYFFGIGNNILSLQSSNFTWRGTPTCLDENAS